MMVLSPAVIGSPNSLLICARLERFSCNDCNKLKLLIVDSSVGIHHIRVHAVERVHTHFLLDAVAPALIASRVQIFLDGLADSHILNLNLITKLYRRFGRGAAQ